MTDKKTPLDAFHSLRREVEGEAKDVVSFVGSLKRAFFADCSKCGDTGVLPSGAFCACGKGAEKIEREENRPELAGGRPKSLPRGSK